jgi:hypothetical protein
MQTGESASILKPIRMNDCESNGHSMKRSESKNSIVSEIVIDSIFIRTIASDSIRFNFELDSNKNHECDL